MRDSRGSGLCASANRTLITLIGGSELRTRIRAGRVTAFQMAELFTPALSEYRYYDAGPAVCPCVRHSGDFPLASDRLGAYLSESRDEAHRVHLEMNLASSRFENLLYPPPLDLRQSTIIHLTPALKLLRTAHTARTSPPPRSPSPLRP